MVGPKLGCARGLRLGCPCEARSLARSLARRRVDGLVNRRVATETLAVRDWKVAVWLVAVPGMPGLAWTDSMFLFALFTETPLANPTVMPP